MRTLSQCIALVCLFAAVCVARVHPTVHRKLLNFHLVHLCQAFSYSFPPPADETEDQVDDHYQRLASHYFSHLSREELRRRIEPLLPRLYPGHRAAVCVVCTLAYFGVDVQKNVRRILFTTEIAPGPKGLPDVVWAAHFPAWLRRGRPVGDRAGNGRRYGLSKMVRRTVGAARPGGYTHGIDVDGPAASASRSHAEEVTFRTRHPARC